MGRAVKLLGVMVVLAAWLASRPVALGADPAQYPNAHLLVGAGWLRARLGDARVRVVDVRGPAAYGAGHVPGAVLLGVEDWRPLRVPVFEDRLGRAGIGRDHTVVIYDDEGGLIASRLFLILEYLGHDRVHILHGGVQAWVASGGPMVKGAPSYPPTAYRAVPRPELIATKTDVVAGLKKDDRVLLDTRSAREFHGQDVRAARAGHIPGARHVEWTENLRPEPIPVWKPAQDLGALFAAVGATPEKEIVTYCQTHSRAAHTYFTLRLMGYSRLKAYLGSWEEWGNDPSLPLEK
jgi:thiosulfate/3-mercaptopyruvate sulfurtransferase